MLPEISADLTTGDLEGTQQGQSWTEIGRKKRMRSEKQQVVYASTLHRYMYGISSRRMRNGAAL